MADSLLPSDPQTGVVTEYRPAAGLIRRGLDDALRTLPRRAKTLRVPVDCQTVQLAVDSASEGDIIEIQPGVYQENVTIRKGLTVRGSSGIEWLRLQRLVPHPTRARYVLVREPSEFARLESREEDKPVFSVDLEHGILKVENIGFCGRAGAWWAPQIAIRITRGEVFLKDCQFEGWETADETADVDGKYWEEYWRHYEGSYPIVVSGNSSVLRVEGCRFADDDCGLDVIEGAEVTISGCTFVELVGIDVEQGSVSSRRNLFLGGSPMTVGQGAEVHSLNDSLVGVGTILSSGSSPESLVSFSHATIDSHALFGVAVGPGLVHPDPDGGWIWRAPRISVADSIVRLRPSEHLEVRYCPNIPRAWWEWGTPHFDVWDRIEFIGRNLICAPPDFSGPDPRFGDVEDGQLPLKQGSPAIGAASDGTNLGAWQGTPS